MCPPHARLGFSLATALRFNIGLFPLLRRPLHLERRLFLLISLIYRVRLGFRPNTKTEPYKRIVLLLNHLILPLLMVVMETPLAAPNQASCPHNFWLGLTLAVPAQAQVISTPHRLLFLPPYHLLERATLDVHHGNYNPSCNAKTNMQEDLDGPMTRARVKQLQRALTSQIRMIEAASELKISNQFEIGSRIFICLQLELGDEKSP